MRFILSDGNSINSKGYKMEIGGIRMERFSANPVMLYGHDDEKVIGRWENPVKENSRLTAEAVFDMEDPTGKEISRKVDKNFIRSASIGVIPLKLEMVDDVFVMMECELVEASIVSIPSDAGAVRLFNEELEELSFDEVKLNFNFNHNNQKKEPMAEVVFKLSQKTAESLNLTGDYTAKDVELAVLEKDREIETLKTSLKAMEQGLQNEFLSNAVKSGKITEAERLSYARLCEKGCFDEVKTIIESKKATASEKLADQVKKSNLTAGRETWDYLKWMKEDPKGLARLKAENPKEFERLQESLKS